MASNPSFNPTEFLYVGIKGHVVALRKTDGSIAWTTCLAAGSSFVPVVQEGDRVYAASGGEVSCLDCATGKVLWHNTMKGFGMGFAALAGSTSPAAIAELERIASTSAAIAAASG
jgi:outer membrane protein assembly factor BamB